MAQTGGTRALLLDLDGTILDTQELIFRCYSDTLRAELGLLGNRESWDPMVGLPLEEIFAAALAPCERRPVLIEGLVSSYRARMLTLDAHVRPFPGMPEALAALRDRGVRLAVVTTKHSTLAGRHLELMRLSSLFEAVVTGDRCEFRKPHPEPFLRALDLLGAAPAEAAGIGDTPYDIRSARAAGLLTAGAAWGASDRAALEAAGPDHLFEHPKDLLTLTA
jgi:pyrophosphatase PpaX